MSSLRIPLIWSLLCVSVLAAPIVSNVTASQRTDGTGLVDVSYTISGTTGPSLVQIAFSNDNGSTWNIVPRPEFLTGSFGPGITAGDHQIAWDAARDRAGSNWPNARARVTATELGNNQYVTISGLYPATFEFTTIPAGTFNMGRSDLSACSGNANETPLHQVTIANEFQMGVYEVTQQQWYAVMNGFPRDQPAVDLNLPVTELTWNEVAAFIVAINGLGIGTFRLPTEAEWEYAHRAGTTTCWHTGDDFSTLSDYAWYAQNSPPPGVLSPVGQKLPNLFGLYDTAGNASEFVQDWYHDDYTGAPTDGTAWLDPVGTSRVVRGGSAVLNYIQAKSARRFPYAPDTVVNQGGFRLVRVN